MKVRNALLSIYYILCVKAIDLNLRNLVNSKCFSKIRIDLDGPCKDFKLMKKCQFATCVVPRFNYSEEKNICKVGRPENNKCKYYENKDKNAIGVDLKQAEQVYSGYTDGASDIWLKIHQEAAAYPLIAKLVSGIHFSITVHIAVYYKLIVNEYFSNPLLYHKKFNPEFLDNLGFALKFVRYAVGCLEKKNIECSIELSKNDSELLNNVILRARKFSGPPIQLVYYENIFAAISKLLNCIECDKCKLWGKIQFNGLKVAMDIVSGKGTNLVGNDLICIIQLLYKLESSEYFANELQKKIKWRYFYFALLYSVELGTLIISMTLFYFVNKLCTHRNKCNKKESKN